MLEGIKQILTFLSTSHRFLRYLTFHDFSRMTKYMAFSGEKRKTAELRILCHSIEKAFAIHRTKRDFGATKVRSIIKILQANRETIDPWLFDYAKDILAAYYVYRCQEGLDASFIPHEFISTSGHGKCTQMYGAEQISQADCFEHFARSRHSSRFFGKEPVSSDLIKRAIGIAQTAPSACNRQSTTVYAVTNKHKIQQIMDMHRGTSGIEKPAVLMVLTGDLGYYINEYERHTVFYDGGIFAMNLLYSLHSFKLATIPIIWGSIPENDSKLRLICHIPNNETIVGLILAGHFPAQPFPVAQSRRKPLDRVLKIIE